MYFTETHIQIMSRGLLEPGEQLTARSVVVDAPWWTMGMYLFHKTYLVLSTNQRLVMVEHKRDFFGRGLKVEKVHSVPWNQVQEIKVKGLFLKKKLRIVAQSNMRFFKGKMKIPNAFFGLLAPVDDNLQNARVLEQQHTSMRQLGAGQQYASLPPGSMPPQQQQQWQQQQSGYPQQAPQYYPQA
jgi:hypothetical protein